MALPPEDLDDLMPQATRVLVATVAELIEAGPLIPRDPEPNHWTGPIPPDPWQLLQLMVHRTLLGPTCRELVVYKPAAPYTLTPGLTPRGAFLLAAPVGESQGAPVVLGRYGPDLYPVEEVESWLDRHRSTQT